MAWLNRDREVALNLKWNCACRLHINIIWMKHELVRWMKNELDLNERFFSHSISAQIGLLQVFSWKAFRAYWMHPNLEEHPNRCYTLVVIIDLHISSCLLRLRGIISSENLPFCNHVVVGRVRLVWTLALVGGQFSWRCVGFVCIGLRCKLISTALLLWCGEFLILLQQWKSVCVGTL